MRLSIDNHRDMWRSLGLIVSNDKDMWMSSELIVSNHRFMWESVGSVASRLQNCGNHAECIYRLYKWKASVPIHLQKMRKAHIFQ